MDAVDELRNPALADAAPHELDVSKVVVVAKDGHAPIARPEAAQSFDEPPRVKLSGRVAREVAGYGDEVGALLVDLLDQPVRALWLRPVVEVEVAELDQPVAVELRCQPGQRELHGPNLHPAGLHLPRVEEPAQERGRRGDPPPPLRVAISHVRR